MRLAWATDLHLNFIPHAGRRRFLEATRDRADALVVSGDIAESTSLVGTLHEMAAVLRQPIYFVLGNHDYYHGSVAATRRSVAAAVVGSRFLVYLSGADVVELAPGSALVGHDGWGDARLGDFEASDVVLNDFFLIDELRQGRNRLTVNKPRLREVLQALGDEAAAHLKRVLPRAAARYPHVIVITHVPPFRNAAWYQGHPSGDDYLPFFACKAAGDTLLDAARAHPDCRFVVLCGHTHGGGQVQILANLRVVTGPAEYGEPQIQQVMEVE
jgi:predicted phosphohydrolase